MNLRGTTRSMHLLHAERREPHRSQRRLEDRCPRPPRSHHGGGGGSRAVRLGARRPAPVPARRHARGAPQLGGADAQGSQAAAEPAGGAPGRTRVPQLRARRVHSAARHQAGGGLDAGGSGGWRRGRPGLGDRRYALGAAKGGAGWLGTAVLGLVAAAAGSAVSAVRRARPRAPLGRRPGRLGTAVALLLDRARTAARARRRGRAVRAPRHGRLHQAAARDLGHVHDPLRLGGGANWHALFRHHQGARARCWPDGVLRTKASGSGRAAWSTTLSSAFCVTSSTETRHKYARH